MKLSNLKGAEGSKISNNFRRGRRGFKNPNRLDIVTINLSQLERFENGTVVNNKLLKESGLVKNCRDGVKVLGKGELTKKLTIEGLSFSASAKAKIESLGGTCKEFDNKEATA